MRAIIFYKNEDGGVAGLSPVIEAKRFVYCDGTPSLSVIYEIGGGYYYFEHSERNAFVFTVFANDVRLNDYRKRVSGLIDDEPEIHIVDPQTCEGYPVFPGDTASVFKVTFEVVDQDGVAVPDFQLIGRSSYFTYFMDTTDELGKVVAQIPSSTLTVVGYKQYFDFFPQEFEITEDTTIELQVTDVMKDIALGTGKTIIFDEIIFLTGKKAVRKEIRAFPTGTDNRSREVKKAFTNKHGRFKLIIDSGKDYMIEIPSIGVARQFFAEEGLFNLSTLIGI